MALSDLGIRLPTGTGLTSGLPGALTASLVTLHTPPAGEKHEIYMWVQNPNATQEDITIRIKDGSNNRDQVFTIDAKTKELAIDGIRIDETITIQSKYNGSNALFVEFKINRID